MNREEAHRLLDAVLDANEKQDRYDVECYFHNNYDGVPMAIVRIKDNQADETVLKVQHRTSIVRTIHISEITVSVPDAVKEIQSYQEGKR